MVKELFPIHTVSSGRPGFTPMHLVLRVCFIMILYYTDAKKLVHK